ncbi:MAG: hypothetical protein DMG65_04990 [Candidatus Angelobacter sp. Gp1-AA117]|nr:MAG: hypothetical protein DMG65_04990 [Candidatus Angelobacter sp. Gp1-AA117]
MAKVFSPTVYSTRPFTSWVESATMLFPFFRWMTSACAAMQMAARNRYMNLNRKPKNCSKYVPVWKLGVYLITKIMTVCLLLAALGHAQSAAPQDPALGIYRQLLNPVLSAADVHKIRQVAIDREDLHVVLEDGTIAFIQAVDGHITGAVFEGEGEILLVPPGRAERTSLALFTRQSVLDEHFRTAFLRFFDDKLAEELRAGFREPEDAQEFVNRWQEPARTLARSDSLVLLQSMTNAGDTSSHYFHLRLLGSTLGLFDVFFNTNTPEQFSVAQAAQSERSIIFDVWTSFPMRSVREAKGPSLPAPIRISDFRLHSKVEPPTNLEVEAELTLFAGRPGQRALILELSRYLKVSEVKLDGKPVAFIQNESVEGTELARHGNDLMTIILPAALEKGRPVKITLKYAGAVMFDAGGEVLYVGARGTWYPQAGAAFANFDLTFEYPANWTLVATGKRVSSATKNGQHITRFVPDKPIAHAGFNMGKFESESASAGDVIVSSYASQNIEASLAQRLARARLYPEPAKQVERTAHQAANAILFLSSELDPFPYSSLEITQLPALLSQSWPGLIYLSSTAFLTPGERTALGIKDTYLELLFSELMLTHETAHQWWGDAVDWQSYRDEWMIEALANYSALLMLENEDSEKMKIVLDHYRAELLKDTPNGIVAEAGPVTLGGRLTSSMFPVAYETVLYGRGTWLIHMLRTTLRRASGGKSDALFFKALKGLLAKSDHGKISTRDLQEAFEQVLPPELTYEGRKSLDWFFDSWVNGISIPQFEVEDLHLVPAGKQVKVSGTIKESHAAKDLVTAVPVYGKNAKGDSQFIGFVFVDEPKTEFTLNAPAGTKDIVLDPENTILRR